jgi:hypothetical protein
MHVALFAQGLGKYSFKCNYSVSSLMVLVVGGFI